MGTTKRQRQKEGRQARLEAAQAAQKKAQRLRAIRNVAIFLVLFVGVVFVLSKVLGDDDDQAVDVGDASSTTQTSSPTDDSVAESPEVTSPPPGETLTGDTPCPEADGSSARTTTFAAAPPMCIDAAKSYTAEVVTSKGTFTVELDDDAAPLTVNNFVVLARYHYYDGVAFHRIIPGFVVQGGDANGAPPGTGGPGYEFADELPTGDPAYELGSLAMANSGPNTNGSQFFVVTGDQGVSLPASYSRFGKVTEGMDVVLAIEAIGSDAGEPTEVVTIDSVTISET